MVEQHRKLQTTRALVISEQDRTGVVISGQSIQDGNGKGDNKVFTANRMGKRKETKEKRKESISREETNRRLKEK